MMNILIILLGIILLFEALYHEKTAARRKVEFFAIRFGDFGNPCLEARYEWSMPGENPKMADCLRRNHGFDRLAEDHLL